MAGRRSDPETTLIVRTVAAFDLVSPQVRARVLSYLLDRYPISPAQKITFLPSAPDDLRNTP